MGAHRRSAGGELFKCLVLLACSLLIAGLLGEGLVRLFLPEWAPRTARLTNFWRYDPRYGWSHIPGKTGRFESHGFETAVAINSRGFRGPEVGYTRGDNARRVLVLGDSFVWGFGVEYDEIFATRLEGLLQDLETVNLGVSGYSTDQELLLYEDEGRKYDADLVVVVVAANDIASNARTTEYLIYGKPAFALRKGRLALMNQPVAKTRWVRRTAVQVAWQSHILTGLVRYLNGSKVARIPARTRNEKHDGAVSGALNGAKREFPRTRAEEILARLLVEFKQTTSADGAELLVVFVDNMRVAGEAANFLTKFDIDSLLLDEYIDGNDEALHLPDGFHWSPAGHEIIATLLAEKIAPKLPKLRNEVANF